MNDNTPESKSLIRELKSQIRKEKIFSLAKTHQKNLTYFLSLVVLVAVFFAAFSFYTQNQSKKYSTILHQSIIDEQNGEKTNSREALKNIYESNAPAGVKGISSLKYAASLMRDGKIEEGIDAYVAISKNKKFNDYVREYSGLIALKTLVDLNKPENKDQIIALESRLEKESRTLKYYIIEQKGVFLWNSGDFKTANEAFKSIAENIETPEALKKRAIEMVEIYKSKFGNEIIAKTEDKSAEEKTTNQAK
jgi:hypothetical protein